MNIEEGYMENWGCNFINRSNASLQSNAKGVLSHYPHCDISYEETCMCTFSKKVVQILKAKTTKQKPQRRLFVINLTELPSLLFAMQAFFKKFVVSNWKREKLV